MSRSYKKNPVCRISAPKSHRKERKLFNRRFRRKLNQGEFDDFIENNKSGSLFKILYEGYRDDYDWKSWMSFKDFENNLKKEYSEYINNDNVSITKVYKINPDDIFNFDDAEVEYIVGKVIREDSFDEHIKNELNQYKKDYIRK